jgi:hypothetical protein
MRTDAPMEVRLRLIAVACALAAFLGGAIAAAQSTAAVTEDWVRSIPDGIGVMMDLDAGDNVFAVGYTVSTDVLTRKYSGDGDLLWERPWPTPNERARPSWISTDPAGNAFVSAYRVTGSHFDPAGWVVLKYNSAGKLLWRRALPGPLAETVRVETDPAGNAYVVGTLFHNDSSGTTSVDAMTVKFAPDGTRLWTRFFNGGPSVRDEPRSLAVSDDGSRVGVVGYSGGASFTVIYGADGRRLGANVQLDLGTAWDAAFGPQNQLYVGASSWTPATSDRMTITRFAADGKRLWTRHYPQGDVVRRIVVDSSGSVIATGTEGVYTDWMTLKVDANGAPLWSRRYDGFQSNDERPFFIGVDPSNNIYVTGEGGPAAPGPITSNPRMTTVKYAPGGARRWVLFTPQGQPRGVSVRIGTNGAIYLQGLGQMATARYIDAASGGAR